MEKYTIELGNDTYNALQQIKVIFSQITWEINLSDEEVIGILISWFLQWLEMQENQDNQSNILLE